MGAIKEFRSIAKVAAKEIIFFIFLARLILSDPDPSDKPIIFSL